MSEIIIYDPEEIIELLPDIEITFDDEYDSVQESVVSKENPRFKIAVDGPGFSNNGFINKPYFKVYKGQSFDKTPPKDRARISFNSANYVEHTTAPATWKLNSSERKELVKILNSKPTNLPKTLNNYKIDPEPDSIWKVALAIANAESTIEPKDIEKKGISMMTKIPDYENGIEPENDNVNTKR